MTNTGSRLGDSGFRRPARGGRQGVRETPRLPPGAAPTYPVLAHHAGPGLPLARTDPIQEESP